MFAEIERLLSQVRSETGRDALAAATAAAPATTPARPAASVPRTGVGPIDAALRPADVTAAQPVVELVGAPGSGKTQTLYRICATLAMAADSGGGGGAHVLFVDAGGTADMQLLAQAMRGADGATDAAVAGALQRVHVFAPATTAALVATLAMLPKYTSERGIDAAALVVDGLGCNFWFDRKESSFLRLQIPRATTWFRQQQQLVDTLHAACASLGCVAFAANTLLLRDTAAAAARSAAPHERTFAVADRRYRDHAIPRWQSIVARTFVLESAAGPGCPRRTRVTFRAATAAAAGAHGPRVADIGPLGLLVAPEAAVPPPRQPWQAVPPPRPAW